MINEYRSGNSDAFNKIIDDKCIETINTKDDSYDYTKIKVKNEDLLKMIKKAWNTFTLSYKFAGDNVYWKKSSASKFNGEYEELILIFLDSLVQMAKDKEFQPTDDIEVFKELKYRVSTELHTIINQCDTTNTISLDVETEDEEGESIQDTISDKYSYQQYLENKSIEDGYYGYIGVMRELIHILKSIDTNKLFPENATFQKNLVELLKCKECYTDNIDKDFKFDKYDGTCNLKTFTKVAELYYKRYGYLPTDKQINEAFNKIFETLCGCTLHLADIPFNRKAYVKKKKAPISTEAKTFVTYEDSFNLNDVDENSSIERQRVKEALLGKRKDVITESEISEIGIRSSDNSISA